MTRNAYIATRFREVFLNGRWIANTNYKEQLLSVSWQQATQTIGTLNTIAALACHVNYYVAGLLQVFDGGELEIRDKYSFDFPAVQSAKEWETAIAEFLDNAEKFANYVEYMPDEKFDEVFVDERYGTYLRNIEGIIEHSYYHLGQISLIKKLLAENKRNVA